MKIVSWMSRMFFIAFLLCNIGIAQATELPAAIGEITNDQMVSFYEQALIDKSVWVFDSRPASKFESGHIPGAKSLPLDLLKKDPSVVDRMAIPKDGKIVFYCAGRECTLSIDSAAIFKASGYTDVWVYRNGVPGWNQKAQPLLAELPLIKRGNVILLDTSPGQSTIVSNNSQTVQLTLDELSGPKGTRVFESLSRNAPIVVIERNGMPLVLAALESLRELDFRRLAYLPLTAWPGQLSMAPSASVVTWSPVYGPGQVAPSVFESAVASGSYILDVRPAADFARGHFKGAVNLPIENLESDYVKVPKDVAVFVHCATGAKSQKTYDILGRKGYTLVSYLDAEISCKGESCSIKE